MNTTLLLRIASLLMLLHTIGHTFGALRWKSNPDPKIAETITSMQENHFKFMGRPCSLAAFYEGYGYTLIIVLLFVSSCLWLLAGGAPGPLALQLLWVFCSFLLLLAVLEYIYFFPFAAGITFLAFIFSSLALYKMAGHAI